ncbi:hypothetical protein [Streptomyces eurythermus]|uniref:hypothetical protein n=1 Tax=Streptomyces eurythermus TaxID=42237 RepID=UPI001999180C|nr:hypothetical protein GCM10010236_10440 [Streptomyces eurythermus]
MSEVITEQELQAEIAALRAEAKAVRKENPEARGRAGHPAQGDVVFAAEMNW